MPRNISLDIFKLLLSFFVVGLHIRLFEDINANLSFFFNQGVFRIAVPMFLVISGYYFERIQNISMYKKWIKRILILYLFWMTFYFPVWITPNFNMVIVNIFKGFFHLWYIIGIAYCSFILFIIRNWKIKNLLGLMYIIYFLGVALQYLHSYDHIYLPNYVYRNFIFFCLPFFISGFIIKKMENKSQRKILIGLVFSLLLFFSEVILNSIYAGNQIFDLLFSFIILCPFLFIVVNKIETVSNTKSISLVSSSVYFIHPMIFILLNIYFKLNTITLFLLTICISLLASYPLIQINKKLSVL